MPPVCLVRMLRCRVCCAAPLWSRSGLRSLGIAQDRLVCRALCFWARGFTPDGPTPAPHCMHSIHGASTQSSCAHGAACNRVRGVALAVYLVGLGRTAALAYHDASPPK